MPYNDCKECQHYNKDSCPLSACSERLKQQACPFLKLRIVAPDEKTNDLITLHRPGEPLPSSKFPKWLTEKKEYKEMDYNRNDTKEIVNSMRPYNN